MAAVSGTEALPSVEEGPGSLQSLQKSLKNNIKKEGQINDCSSSDGGLPESPQSPVSSPTSSIAKEIVKIEAIDVKLERDMSPLNTMEGTSANFDDKQRINNNVTTTTTVITSAAFNGGRLKFFKEGRCLLELTHKSNNDGEEAWVPITKKVYWPPPGPVKAESSPSVHSASEAGSDVGSSIPSPWQPGSCLLTSSASIPVPVPVPAVPVPGGGVHTVRASRKFRCSKPVAFRKQPHHVKNELCFAMKPMPCLVSLRKKVRNLKKKRRTPYSPILIGAFLMRLESQAVKTRAPKRPQELDRIKKSSRLESTVTKLNDCAKKIATNGPGGPTVQVQIQAWKSSSSSGASSGSVKSSLKNHPPPLPPTHHILGGVTTNKVKSELCPVTETCTASTMPLATQATPTSKHRVKAEKTVSISSTCMLSSNTNTGLGHTPTSVKTLPITPTMARIKGGGHAHLDFSSATTATSFMSPDMQRVKVEIGHVPFNYRSPPDMPRLPTSPVPHPLDVRDGHFVSPRKRSILRDFENGSPSLKKHRLSTDSRGSSSEGGGAGSPASSSTGFAVAASPPRVNNGGGRVSSFSIDSIMSSSSNGGGGGGGAIHRPVPIPASPARVNDLRSEGRASSRSPARSLSPVHAPPITMPNTPLVVPITPYQSRGTPFGGGGGGIDPRLAHLAGVAADPRFGLTPTYSPAMAAVMSSYYSPFAANQLQLANQLVAAAHAQQQQQQHQQQQHQQHHQQQQQQQLWATPTTTMATPITSSYNPIPSMMSASAAGNRTLFRQASGSPDPPNLAATPPNRPFSPWGVQQYRGEPRVSAATPTTPRLSSSAELQNKRLTSQSLNSDSGDLPLNLCMQKK